MEPPTSRGEHAFLAKPRKKTRYVFPLEGEDIGEILLGQFDTRTRSTKADINKIDKVAQSPERTVVFLMSRFINMKVNPGGIQFEKVSQQIGGRFAYA